MWKTVVEGGGSDVHRASRQPDLLIGSRDEPRGRHLSGGPERLLTPRSVTHLPLSLRGAATDADETSDHRLLLRRFKNNAGVGFPSDGAVHMDVGAIKGHSSARGEAGLSLTPARPSPRSLRQAGKGSSFSASLPSEP